VGYYSAKVIFSRLNIKAAAFDSRTDDARALQKIVDGEADAYITGAGKVFGLARNLKNENGALHLVPIPYDRRLQDMYLPTTLSSEDYPNLLSPGETIDTVATSVLLVSFNWTGNTERYNRGARFVNVFFSKIDEFMKPPRHPKWKESSIAATIPGSQRFKAADEWLTRHNMSSVSQSADVERIRFEQFLSENRIQVSSDPSRRDAVFRQFLEWERRKVAP
jgi:hypothetical protein